MLIGDNRSGTTATEIVERQEEKLLMLGPVLESLQDELLSPLVEMTFVYMLKAGLVPEPPQELDQQPLVIQFVSLLAQAQKLVGIGSIDRLLGTLSVLTESKPEVWDKVDSDQVVDVYADLLGTDPKIIVSDENVALIREERAALKQAEQAAVVAPPLAAAAKDVNEIQNSQISPEGQGLQQSLAGL